MTSQFLLHVPSALGVTPTGVDMTFAPINVPQPAGLKQSCCYAGFMKQQALLPLPVMYVFHKA
ncbi:MAG: hypothetical protein Q4A31_06770 [Corynebacterium sp.]|uniref:hypothetical protein n=1 Tax=Corynebacterium sp. TaxID=1720 RepID=UPI0026DD66AE|nr:hypothetical protein [Corynebacterium sp.]MDO4761602.1 hypothetical protein [Corynebacterium sp.]